MADKPLSRYARWLIDQLDQAQQSDSLVKSITQDQINEIIRIRQEKTDILFREWEEAQLLEREFTGKEDFDEMDFYEKMDFLMDELQKRKESKQSEHMILSP